MTPRMKPAWTALAAVLALGPAIAMAQYSPTREDSAQLKADQSALTTERAQLATDINTRKADKAEGKMAAESRDSMRVFRDQQAIRGEHKDIAADQPGSLQSKVDKKELGHEQAKLKSDEHRERMDRAEGRMAATSPDGEKIYQDRVAVRGQQRAIATDRADLKADSKQ